MAAGGFLLLLLSLHSASTLSFYGDSITFSPPHKQRDGTFKVTLFHRQNGRDSCVRPSSFSCGGSVCPVLGPPGGLQTDRGGGPAGGWCQSEQHTATTASTSNNSLSLRSSGCCWTPNVAGATTWSSEAELDLGTRSDTHGLNSCPVSATVSSLRVPQNCFSRLRLLAHDPDGDFVRCLFSNAAPSNFTLDEATCTLTSGGGVHVGVHVLELSLQDAPRRDVTLTYADGTTRHSVATATLCRLTLKFSLEVLPPVESCEVGRVLPEFLSTTPSQAEVLHATVGQKFQLIVQAQAHHSSIHDFQVSGPQNLTKEFRDVGDGKAEVRLSWTPQQADVYRHVPLCFTAETNHTQSEMRCVVVMVTQASVIEGKAIVKCDPNVMSVALEKASMPGIDENFLQLRDPSCSLTSNSTHIMGSMSFSTCGTRVEDNGDFIVFKNEINSFERPTEVITRRKKVRIDFSCMFPRTFSLSSFYDLHSSDYIFTESSFGSFGYTFEIFRDANFSRREKVSAYPVEVKLLEPIFMGIQAQARRAAVSLLVEACRATPDDNPENSLHYDLIRNGCLEDDTIKVHPSNDSSFNFEVQAFKFTGNYDQVFITCSVILCESGSSFSRCAQGCLKDPARRRRRGLARETRAHYITQGPLQFTSSAVPNAAVEENDTNTTREMPPPVVPRLFVAPDSRFSRLRELLGSRRSTVVLSSLFVLCLLLAAIVIRHFVRKRKADDQSSLLVADWEN